MRPPSQKRVHAQTKLCMHTKAGRDKGRVVGPSGAARPPCIYIQPRCGGGGGGIRKRKENETKKLILYIYLIRVLELVDRINLRLIDVKS
jgi:hypothetical protein